jgi:NAD(P)-dependent dehydrogenase (short-subunit alcohol dehydrogenase family)
MTWTSDDIPDLSGRIALVTGANGGLGLECAKALAAKGAHVIMAARNQDKAGAALAEIRRNLPGASLELVPLDLASLDSVRTAAKQVLSAHHRLDILLNNAGVMALPERRTQDGFEMQLAVNHLGHFALTAHLLDAILQAPAARVVSVTSYAHHMGRALDPANPHLEGRYRPWRAYGQAKLANLHFAIGLQQRFEKAGVKAASLAAHPGHAKTELQATSVSESGGWSQRFFHFLVTRTGMSPARGARPQLRAATDPRARGGELYAPRFLTNGPAVRRPVLRPGMRKAIDRLWEVSERETGTTLTVA